MINKVLRVSDNITLYAITQIYLCFASSRMFGLQKSLLTMDETILNYTKLDVEGIVGYQSKFKLSTHGFMHAESLMQSSKDSRKVFIATPFGQVLGYPTYQEIRDNAIKPAVIEASGETLIAFTVNEHDHNDDITDKIVAEIKTSKFVIMDLTHSNNGAYWEAGFAKGLGKPVIYICNQEWIKEGNRVHFDVEHINCIRYRSLEDLKYKLINRIRATVI